MPVKHVARYFRFLLGVTLRNGAECPISSGNTVVFRTKSSWIAAKPDRPSGVRPPSARTQNASSRQPLQIAPGQASYWLAFENRGRAHHGRIPGLAGRVFKAGGGARALRVQTIVVVPCHLIS